MLMVVRMLFAWMLAVVGSTLIANLLRGSFASRGKVLDGLLGVGLLVGVPMFAFSALIALPLSYYLASIRSNWLATLVAVVIFGVAAMGLAVLIFPPGWKGAAQAFVIFAAMLGLFWGLIGLVIVRSPVAT